MPVSTNAYGSVSGVTGVVNGEIVRVSRMWPSSVTATDAVCVNGTGGPGSGSLEVPSFGTLTPEATAMSVSAEPPIALAAGDPVAVHAVPDRVGVLTSPPVPNRTSSF